MGYLRSIRRTRSSDTIHFVHDLVIEQILHVVSLAFPAKLERRGWSFANEKTVKTDASVSSLFWWKLERPQRCFV